MSNTATPHTPEMNSALKMMSFAPQIDRAGMTDRQKIVQQMADDILHFAGHTGSAERVNMAVIGWTEQQIDLHGTAASRLAQRLGADRKTERAMAIATGNASTFAVTVRPTAKFEMIEGTPARIWEGETADGTHVEFMVPVVRSASPGPNDLDRALTALKGERQMVSFDTRLAL
jgi:hypothetical protein